MIRIFIEMVALYKGTSCNFQTCSDCGSTEDAARVSIAFQDPSPFQTHFPTNDERQKKLCIYTKNLLIYPFLWGFGQKVVGRHES